jgi:hypothetical protein
LVVSINAVVPIREINFKRSISWYEYSKEFIPDNSLLGIYVLAIDLTNLQELLDYLVVNPTKLRSGSTRRRRHSRRLWKQANATLSVIL